MEEGEIATVGDMHTCPMVTGGKPHVGGKIISARFPGVTIDGKPIAVVGDVCECNGQLDTIVTGCSGVTIDGIPVATVGDMTAHGGVIISGSGVTISKRYPDVETKPAVMAAIKIPFPDITRMDRVKAALAGHSKLLEEAETKQKKIKEMASNAEPSVYNLQWIRKDIPTYEGQPQEILILHADTSGYAEGETVKLSIYHSQDEEKVIEELSGVVRNGSIDIEWPIDKEKISLEND